MEKKYWFIFAAVLLFFGGAIWVSEAPIWAPLVAFLEVAGGFALGYLFNKSVNQVKMAIAEENQLRLSNEVMSLKDALNRVDLVTAVKAGKIQKSTKKNKE